MVDTPVYPQQELASGNNDFNQISFVIKQALSRLNIATLVEVVAVHGGGTGITGTVDVTPLVSQVDGANQVIPHTIVYGIPYLRVQGGANAVIVDPIAGDIGFALSADRDISTVKVQAQAGNVGAPPNISAIPPASERRFSLSDALYFGGWNVGTPPTAYVQVTQAAIKLVLPDGSNVALTPGLCTVNATATKINGTLEVSGNATFDSQTESKGLLLADANFYVAGTMSGSGGAGTISINVPISSSKSIQATNFSNGTIDFNGHYHNGVTTGSGNTGAPTGG